MKNDKKFVIYGVSQKTLIDPKPLHIMLDKVDGFIRDCGGIKYLGLFGPEKYNSIFNRTRYLNK